MKKTTVQRYADRVLHMCEFLCALVAFKVLSIMEGAFIVRKTFWGRRRRLPVQKNAGRDWVVAVLTVSEQGG